MLIQRLGLFVALSFFFAGVAMVSAEGKAEPKKDTAKASQEKGSEQSGKSGKKMDHKHQKPTAAAKAQKLNSPEARKGETVVCPVMGSAFKVTDKSLFYTYKGKKYYVCCAMCIDELKKEPEKYLK